MKYCFLSPDNTRSLRISSMKHSIVTSSIALYALIIMTPSLHGMENQEKPPMELYEIEISEKVVTEGISGWLYTQSWILPKPQLLLYAFEHGYFDYKNKDHKNLVNQALLECLKKSDTQTLEKILTTINQKFSSNNRLIKTRTSRYIHSFLTTLQRGFVLRTQEQLPLTQQNQLVQLSAALSALQKEQDKIMIALHGYKTEQEKELQSFHGFYQLFRQLTYLLHKIDPDIDNDEDLSHCSDIEDDALIDPQLCDALHMNKKVMPQENQFGKDNVFMHSLITELQSQRESTKKLLALCNQDNK